MIELLLGNKPPTTHSGLSDKDLVCFGLDLEKIKEAVSALGATWIIDHRILSNREGKEPFLVKTRIGESDFSITLSKKLSRNGGYFDQAAELFEDALCRDFTVNAVYYDPILEVFSDPLKAANDFYARRLELCSLTGLSEDPVRILRAMSFVSRLGFTAGPKLLEATVRDWPLLAWVPPDRLWPEWRKWALGFWPRFGLEFLRETGALAFWPDLMALINSPQLHKFHPEGDVWNHTLLVVESMSRLNLPVSMGRVFLTMASLLHDIGKPTVTYVRPDGLVVTRGHGPAGIPLARKFLRSVKAPSSVTKPVLKIIERHMDMSFREPTTLSLRVLARRLAPFCDLSHFWALSRADWNGRNPCPTKYPWTLEEFLEPVNGEKGPGAIPLEAKELMAGLDLKGGPMVGRLMEIISSAFDSGKITTSQEAMELAASYLEEPNLCCFQSR
jgi:tRNA nucleotidyltransferase (CCA-adding enzyme)